MWRIPLSDINENTQCLDKLGQRFVLPSSLILEEKKHNEIEWLAQCVLHRRLIVCSVSKGKKLLICLWDIEAKKICFFKRLLRRQDDALNCLASNGEYLFLATNKILHIYQ